MLLSDATDDGITMNRDRLLADAKAKALAHGRRATRRPSGARAPPAGGRARARRHGPSRSTDLRPPGGGNRRTMSVVAGELAEVLSGGPNATSPSPVGEDRSARAGARASLHDPGAPAGRRWRVWSTCWKPASRFETEGDDHGAPYTPSAADAMIAAPLLSSSTRCWTRSSNCARPAGLCEEATPDLVDAVLEEGASFCENELLPLNRSGDEEGCTYENGVVRTPKGLQGSLRRASLEGGWTGLGASTRSTAARACPRRSRSCGRGADLLDQPELRHVPGAVSARRLQRHRPAWRTTR